MSLLDAFEKEKIDFIPVVITQADNGNGVWEETRTEGLATRGVKYNRSTAERYFSQTWESNITDILVVDIDTGLKNNDEIRIGSTYWKCGTPQNVADQNEIWTIGLELKV